MGQIYHGHCQVCEFTFLKKDNNPYFEIHHIDPNQGDYLRNLVVVCANCHMQFEFANLINTFDDEDWLCEICFNDIKKNVFQIIKTIKVSEFFKRQYLLE